MSHPIRFPEDFLWGAATSAWQIEGSPGADGAGLSNWDAFARMPGTMFAGHTADVACDHYRLWARDLELMSELSLGAYRFSIAWSRVLPDGRGAPNPRGLGFYDRLVDGLLARGIRPLATLFHWDLPAALQEQGGWTNPRIVDWFTRYAEVVFEALGDRVPMWATMNEPWVVADAGYLHGVHAPGVRDPAAAALVSLHLMRAHGAAVRAYRARGRHQIGLVVNLEPKDAATDSPEDRAAAARSDAWMNRQYLDAVFFGRFPEELREMFGAAWPEGHADDAALFREPLDFLGINYYKRGIMRDDPGAAPVRAREQRVADALHTEVGWEVHPPGLTRTLRWVRERYGAIPLYVTENGAAFHDPPHPVGGRVDDPQRIHYLREHLIALDTALRAGVDVRGYFVWSLLDNCEWTHGYSKRFGIVHVDYATQQRTLKASARFYREVIRTGGRALGCRNGAGGG